ncbi:hypothetical protein FACHB389_30160 [Nostoc calcicola FACHB-389]|nr:hypothetical protein [Nostoc calcicola FACHB-3891]OKH23877.1 hypothetical protein FACHB389_30160 [Nostoc calcicola FACHB-389]
MNTLERFDTKNFSDQLTPRKGTGFTLLKGKCICEDGCKDSRQSQETGLIFCRKAVNPIGYIYRGQDRHGFGMWQAIEDAQIFSNQAIEERERERRKFLEAQKQQHQLRIEKQMPALERDKWYRLLLAELVLLESDRRKLLARGLTHEQIERHGYKSVRGWQKFKQDFPYNLPGILDNGVLNVHTNAIVAPVVNHDGLIVTLGIRLNESENGRYRTLTSATKRKPDGVTVHLNGEIPITVIEPSKFVGDSIWVTEGIIIKPNIASDRLGVPVLGAPGGRFSNSPKFTEKSLAHLSEKHSTKSVIFALDAGDVANQSSVPQKWIEQYEFLSSLGYECRFAWWGQSNKTCNDIDELPIEKHQFIEYISLERFIALCQKYGGIKPDKQEFIDNYDEKVAAVQKKLHTLSYASDIECDPNQKYLPDLTNKIPRAGIVLLNAAKGSGKSHQINLIKREWCGGYWEKRVIEEPYQLDLLGSAKRLNIERIWHEKTGKKFISINARIALGREQAVKWEFTWLEDADLDKPQEFQHDSEIIQTATVLETIGEIGLCWDSLSKLFDRDWSDTLVIIDEIELGLAHVSSSSTCRDRRSKILHTLEVKLKECLDNDGLIIGADADLTDISYEYLTSIAPKHIPFIVRHNYIRPDQDKWDIEFHTGKRDEILTQIFDHLADKNCKPIALYTDNQAEAEAIANALIKKYPYLKKEIGGLIRIDSKITQTDFGKNFVKRPNESTEKYQPKILIYTPSLGVGCSIDIIYYSCVYALIFGNLEPSQGRQGLARVRQAVPRILWCKDRASNAENDHTSFLPDVIKKQMFQYHETTDNLIETALYLAKEKAKGVDSDAEILPHLIEALQGMMGENGSWNNPHIDLFCKLKARRNYALSQLALQLRQELIDEGHNLVDYTITDRTNTGDLIKEEKEEVKQHRASMVSNAQNITIEEAKQIDRKFHKTEDEEYQSIKAHLTEELPGIELTQEFIYKAVFANNRRWLNQVKLFWMLQNPEATKEIDRKHWRYKLKQFFNGVTCLQDVRTFSTKVDAFIQSKLIELIKLDDFKTEYYESAPSLQDWFMTLLKRNKKSNFIKVAFGFTITKDTQIIKFINRLLGKIGLKLVKSRKGTDDTVYYKLGQETALDADRIAVLQAMTLKYKQQQLEQLAREQLVLEERQRQAVALQQLAEMQSQVEVATTQVTEMPTTEAVELVTAKAIEIAIPEVLSHQSSLELVAAKLRQVSQWTEVNLSQSEIVQAWPLLTQDEQSRIWQLHQEYQRQLSLEQLAQQAIATQAEIKETGFGSHFRSYVLKAVRGGIAIARKCWGDKQECEIPLNQLLLATG